MTYEEYIVSPAWKAKRAIALARDCFRCRLCDSPDDLEVHHRSYGRAFGEETTDDLTTLCRLCHDMTTNSIRERRYSRATVKATALERLCPGRIEDAHGLREFEVQDSRRRTPAHAQRANGRSVEQVLERDGKNIRQAQEDGI